MQTENTEGVPERQTPSLTQAIFKVGQLWRTASGERVRIKRVKDDNCDIYPIIGEAESGVTRTYTAQGWNYSSGDRPELDLVMLLNEAQAAEQPVPEQQADMNELAAETLQSIGWHYIGNCWVQENTVDAKAPSQHLSHPLYPVVVKAIEQAMFGKGERHGGNATPSLEQPWVHYAKMHGRGFLTGQAAKKLEEAASKRTGEAFETEVLGAMVYAGMAVLFERGEVCDAQHS